MKPAVNVTRNMQRKVAKVHRVASLCLLVHLYACNKRIPEQILMKFYIETFY
jgi:hypothetical protein